MRRGLRWWGDPALAARFASWLAAGGDRHAKVLHARASRRVVHFDAARGPAGRGLVAKCFSAPAPARRLREALRAPLGRSSAQREWRCLRRLEGRSVAPVAFGLAREGRRWWLLQERLPARALAELRGEGPTARHRSLAALGACVRRLHDAGLVHGDLHLGNVLWTPDGPRLVDFRAARRARRGGARERELGFLDASLAEWLSAPDRLRVAAAALGLSRPFDGGARAALRRVLRESQRVARARAVRRTRRWQRVGRRAVAATVGEWRGLRVRELSPEALAALVEGHHRSLRAADDRVWKDDGRSAITGQAWGQRRVVVKQVHARGLARALADRWRRSPAGRAWRAAHGLRERGFGAPRALAMLERRRLGVPVASLVLLEDLHARGRSLEEGVAEGGLAAADADAVADAVAALHAAGVDHGDLKSSHVFLLAPGSGSGPRVAFIDLEGLRFRARLSEAARRRALAQLNGSLADGLPAALRERAFARYTRRLPFADGLAARRRILADSLARGDVFTGRDCGAATGAARPRLPRDTIA